jgi:hypothetical protein
MEATRLSLAFALVCTGIAQLANAQEPGVPYFSSEFART